MRIATIGSRIFDDSIKFQKDKEHNNEFRMVGISLFSMTTPDRFADLIKESDVLEDNDYRKMILAMDVNNTIASRIRETQCEAICFDFLDSGKRLWECMLSDNRVIRCTYCEMFEKNLPMIRHRIEEACKVKIKKEQIIDPLSWSDDTLTKEIAAFVTLLKNIQKERKIVLLQAHIPYQYTDGQTVINSPDYNQIAILNHFCDRCCKTLQEQMSCISIPINRFILGGEHYRDFKERYYTEEFYEYLCECLLMIENNTYDEQEAYLHRQYEAKLYERVETITVTEMMKDAYQRLHGRKAILISHSDKLCNVFASVHKIEINTFIPYEEAIRNDGTLCQEILDFAEKSDEYAFIVPYFCSTDTLLEKLWEIGYPFVNDCIIATHENIRLSNFVGEYDDVYDNHFICWKRGVQCYIGGFGAVGKVADSEKVLFSVIFTLQSQARLTMEKDVMCDKLQIALSYGCECVVSTGTSFADNCKICPVGMQNIYIGKDCMFSSKVVCQIGDGHGIFDVNSGSRVNWLPSAKNKGKLDIVLEDHVWVGYQVMILAGTHIGSSSIIGARSLVNKSFPNNCIIAGNPASVVKKDVTWARNPFTKNIYEDECILEDTYIQYTRE